MMSKFKVGDAVRYVRHITYLDVDHFTIGQIYEISYIDSGGSMHLKGSSIDMIVIPSQIELVETGYEHLTLNRSAFETQVGASHYKDMKIQPMEYALANNLNLAQGNVVKYVSRYKAKNGKEDLEKAIHCIQLLIEHEYGEDNE